MRCLYNSHGKPIAVENSGELYDRNGIHIGHHASGFTTTEDEEIIFCGKDGLYLAEITPDYQDRLLRMSMPDESRLFSVGYLPKENVTAIDCPEIDSIDLPEGFEDFQ